MGGRIGSLVKVGGGAVGRPLSVGVQSSLYLNRGVSRCYLD